MVRYLADVGRAGEANLVQAVRATDEQGTPAAEAGQGTRHRFE